MYTRHQGKLVRLGSAKMAGVNAPLDFEIMLPWMPDELVLNAFHDVLARDVTVKRR